MGCIEEWREMIKNGYDPVPSMYPETMIMKVARQNGIYPNIWQLYIYSRMLRKMSETNMSTKTVDKTYKYLAEEPVMHPVRSKDWDGFRAEVILADEWAEYCRRDVEMTTKLYEIIKNKKVKENMRKIPFIKNVIFNDPATIVFWSDDTKTVVKCQNEKFDPEKGLAMAIAKKALGGEHDYYAKNFEKWVGGQLKKEELKPESSTLQIGDKAVVIGNGCTRHNYKNGDIVDIVNRGIASDSMLTAIASRIDKKHATQYIDKVNLKKLTKDQTMRPGDKAVVIKKPSYGCAYTIGETIIIKHCKDDGDIIAMRTGNPYNNTQILRACEVVKIVDDIPKTEPKRMTFREEVAIKEPHRIDIGLIGGVRGCPRDMWTIRDCLRTRGAVTSCTACWDREIPEEDSVLRKGDKAVKVKGAHAFVDNHPIGTVVTIHNDSPRGTNSVITKGLIDDGAIFEQITYRDSLKKLAKDQTFKPGDRLVVVKKPSFCCEYKIGDVIIFKRNTSTGIITTKSGTSADYEQILKADEVIKIVE